MHALPPTFNLSIFYNTFRSFRKLQNAFLLQIEFFSSSAIKPIKSFSFSFQLQGEAFKRLFNTDSHSKNNTWAFNKDKYLAINFQCIREAKKYFYSFKHLEHSSSLNIHLKDKFTHRSPKSYSDNPIF